MIQEITPSSHFDLNYGQIKNLKEYSAWHRMLYSTVEMYGRFKGTCCLNLRSKSKPVKREHRTGGGLRSHHENGSSTYLKCAWTSTRIYIPEVTALHRHQNIKPGAIKMFSGSVLGHTQFRLSGQRIFLTFKENNEIFII
jgi:hypothetical protein